MTLILLAILGTVAAVTPVWTVNCGAVTIQRSDPIINPGITSGHVHAVAGSTAFRRDMSDPHAAANGLATTCDKATDHSNYWAPQLYHMRSDNQFEALPFTGMNAYYNHFSCDYNPSGHCPKPIPLPTFPMGLRMVAGNPARRTFDKKDLWQAAILMESGNDGEVYGMPKKLGDRISGHVRFPSCWDGKNLDSADHVSHVNYPDPKLGGDTQGGMCPQSHPHALPNIGAEFGWNLKGVNDPKSLVWAQGDTTGYGFHGDFIMGWKDPEALQNSWANCFDNNNCPWRSFGSPNGVAPHPQDLVPEILAPLENIGLHGPIPALPGSNPVYKPMRIKGRSVE